MSLCGPIPSPQVPIELNEKVQDFYRYRYQGASYWKTGNAGRLNDCNFFLNSVCVFTFVFTII